MLTQKQKEILTDLMIDNGIIYEESKSALYHTNLRAFERLQSVIKYCHSLFIECVYNATNDNADYIENRLVDLLAGVARYRHSYEVGTNTYKVFNSLFDKIAETFTDFRNTL